MAAVVILQMGESRAGYRHPDRVGPRTPGREGLRHVEDSDPLRIEVHGPVARPPREVPVEIDLDGHPLTRAVVEVRLGPVQRLRFVAEPG